MHNNKKCLAQPVIALSTFGAAFLEYAIGSRALGMDEAYTAETDDMNVDKNLDDLEEILELKKRTGLKRKKKMRNDGRTNSQLRGLRITPDFCPAALGSILFEMGGTRLICAASLSGSVPDHAAKRETGWVTAEYSLLPYSTHQRTVRDLYRRDGRSVEIQRLIARALRSAIDLSVLKNCLITVDCDVLQADGGTRTAAITGGYIDLARSVRRMLRDGILAGQGIQHLVEIQKQYI